MGKHGDSKKKKMAKKTGSGKHKGTFAKSIGKNDQRGQKPKNKQENNSQAIPLQTATSSGASGRPSKLSDLQQKFQKKLEGARFRVINEKLYTCRGSEAFHEFQKNTGMFDVVRIYVTVTSCYFM